MATGLYRRIMNDSLKLLAELQRAAQKFDVIPKGFRTTKEWADAWKCGARTARTLLARGRERGTIKCLMLRPEGSRDKRPY